MYSPSSANYVDQASLVPYRSPQYPDAPIRCNRHAGDSLQVLVEPQRTHSFVCRHFATTPDSMSFGFPQRHCPAHSPRPNRPPDFHGQLKIIEDMDRVLPIARDSKAGTVVMPGHARREQPVRYYPSQAARRELDYWHADSRARPYSPCFAT